MLVYVEAKRTLWRGFLSTVFHNSVNIFTWFKLRAHCGGYHVEIITFHTDVFCVQRNFTICVGILKLTAFYLHTRKLKRSSVELFINVKLPVIKRQHHTLLSVMCIYYYVWKVYMWLFSSTRETVVSLWFICLQGIKELLAHGLWTCAWTN